MKKITILTGSRGQGKSTFLLEKFSGRRGVTGILSIRGEGDKRFFLKMSTGEKWAMEGEEGYEGPWLEVGKFRFSLEAFDKARQYFPVAAIMERAGLFIVDEVGPLELRGEGFCSMLKTLIGIRPGPDILLVVRIGLLEEVKEAFGLQDALVYTQEDFPDDFSWQSRILG